MAQPAAQPAAAANQYQNAIDRTNSAKLPEFWGLPSKDALSARAFANRVDQVRIHMNYTEELTYNQFAMALRGQAKVWLDGRIERIKLKRVANRTWTTVKPLFLNEFAENNEDQAVISQLNDLRFKHGDSIRTHFNRLTDTLMAVDDKVGRPADPANLPADDQQMLVSDARKWCEEYREHTFQKIFFLIYKTSVPLDVKQAINAKDPENLDAAYDVARLHEISCKEKLGKLSALSSTDPLPSLEDAIAKKPSDEVNAVFVRNNQNRNGSKNSQQKQNQRPKQASNGNNQRNNGNGNRTNGEPRFCTYCRMTGHTQDYCRKRIADKEPCRTASGKIYTPNTNGNRTNAIAEEDEVISSIAPQVFQSRT